MTEAQREAVVNALRHWDDEAATKEAFVRANTPDDDGEPICGYREWDEAIEDYNYRLAERGEILAAAVRAALMGVDGSSV